MLQRVWLILILITQLHIVGVGQQIDHEGEVWGAYISSVRVSERWAVWNDFHYATNSFFVSRHGLTYFFSPNVTASGGYAWVNTTTSFSNKLIRDEHRPWGQIVSNYWLTDKIGLQLRFRYDARFRQQIANQTVLDERLFYHRLRGMAMVRFHLFNINGHTNMHFRIMNEYLYNMGDQVVDGMDQNRLYLLPALTHRNLTLLAGYHWRVIPQAHRTVYRHGASIWLLHTIDLRK